jgi:hypothetical protein
MIKAEKGIEDNNILEAKGIPRRRLLTMSDPPET